MLHKTGRTNSAENVTGVQIPSLILRLKKCICDFLSHTTFIKSLRGHNCAEIKIDGKFYLWARVYNTAVSTGTCWAYPKLHIPCVHPSYSRVNIAISHQMAKSKLRAYHAQAYKQRYRLVRQFYRKHAAHEH